MRRILLDTSVLSRYLDSLRRREEDAITRRIGLYLQEHPKLEFSVLSRFEKERGLRDLEATAQLDALDRLCRQSIVHSVDDQVAGRAAQMWALLKKKGRKPSDVDVLIAATADVNGCAVAYADKDFTNFREFVEIEGWLDDFKSD